MPPPVKDPAEATQAAILALSELLARDDLDPPPPVDPALQFAANH